MTTTEQQLAEALEKLTAMESDVQTIIRTVFGSMKKLGIDPNSFKDFKIDQLAPMIGQIVMNFQMGLITADSFPINDIKLIMDKYAYLMPDGLTQDTPKNFA